MVQITREEIKDDGVVEIIARRFNINLHLYFLGMCWSPFSKRKKYIMIAEGQQDNIKLFNQAYNLIDNKQK